jgi:hypothetical protein
MNIAELTIACLEMAGVRRIYHYNQKENYKDLVLPLVIEGSYCENLDLLLGNVFKGRLSGLSL